MMLRRALLVVTVIALSLGGLATLSVSAFFDAVDELQAELQAWQTSTTTDFTADLTDVVGRIDEIMAPTFYDVAENTWFYPYVSSVADWGIVTGYKDASGEPMGEYRPGNAVTVAEALKMAFEAAQVDESQCLRPVLLTGASEHWAKNYVSCAEESGMRLFQTSSLSLNRPATRAEVLMIIHDVFGDVVPNLLAAGFDDVSGHKYESDVAYAAARGIVSGDTDADGNPVGRFRPDGTLNRAEVAKIIYERLRADVLADAV